MKLSALFRSSWRILSAPSAAAAKSAAQHQRRKKLLYVSTITALMFYEGSLRFKLILFTTHSLSVKYGTNTKPDLPYWLTQERLEQVTGNRKLALQIVIASTSFKNHLFCNNAWMNFTFKRVHPLGRRMPSRNYVTIWSAVLETSRVGQTNQQTNISAKQA